MTGSFPADERSGLVSQMRRAAVSVGSNIAEGAEATRVAEFGRYLSIALGSLAELAHQLTIAERVGYVDPTSAARARERLVELRRMIIALRRGRARNS